MVKIREERSAFTEGVRLVKFRYDNGIFKSKDFHEYIELCGQTITHCGAEVHYQNGVVERYTRKITEIARTYLLCAHYLSESKVNFDLWPFAVRYYLDVWNDTPLKDLNWQTPDSFFAQVTLRKKDISRRLDTLQPFGCPCYVIKSYRELASCNPWDYR